MKPMLRMWAHDSETGPRWSHRERHAAGLEVILGRAGRRRRRFNGTTAPPTFRASRCSAECRACALRHTTHAGSPNNRRIP